MSTKTHDVTEYRPFPNEEGRNSRQAQLEIPALVKAMGLPTGARILEVGCGRGIALPVLDRLCGPSQLVGLDIEKDFLVEADENLRDHGTEAELIHGDVRRIPFGDESFDVIIDFGTIYHIADQQTAIDEITRVLAPGGIFVYETKASQFIAHPVRSRGRRISTLTTDGLPRRSWAMLWASRTKSSQPVKKCRAGRTRRQSSWASPTRMSSGPRM